MTRNIPKTSTAAIEATAADWIVREEAGLTAEQRLKFEQWLAADPRNGSALLRHRQAWSLLDRPRSSGRAPEMEQVLQRALVRRRNRHAVVLAALLIFGLAGGLTWKRIGLQTDPSSIARVIMPQTQTLSDGTVIESKAGSQFSVDYSAHYRRVTLKNGEAIFRVAKNKERPFVVTAGGIDVRAVGTAFAVGFDPKLVDVIVTEGIVSVGRTAELEVASRVAPLQPTTNVTPVHLVSAGKRLTVERAAEGMIPEASNISLEETAERLAWRATRLEFFHTPLAEAVALLNQHSSLRLVVDDPELAKLPVNGMFRADHAETLVRLLEASFDVKADHAGDTITLRRVP